MNSNSVDEIWDVIKASNNIIIPLHVSPDGDSFGSAMAMYHLLSYMGKKVTVTSAEEIGGYFDLLDEYKIIHWGKDILQVDLSKFDTLIALDVTALWRFAKDGESLGFKAPESLKIIAIDHHPNFGFFGHANLHFPKASSTAEILFDLILENKETDAPWDKNIPEYKKMILLGILSDTGFLRWAVTPSLMIKVSNLMMKVNYKVLWEIMLYNYPEKSKRFCSLVLKNTIYNAPGKFVYSMVMYEELSKNNIFKSEASGSSDMLKDIRGYDFCFTIIEKEKGIFTVSFRSQKGVDVSVFAEALGNGGGHKAAAGVVIRGESAKEVEEGILCMLKKTNSI
jgi:phosphoesterase RecJ-like protein